MRLLNFPLYPTSAEDTFSALTKSGFDISNTEGSPVSPSSVTELAVYELL